MSILTPCKGIAPVTQYNSWIIIIINDNNNSNDHELGFF